MKILVEACLGLGDVIEATPLCYALHLLGHDVDLYLNTRKPDLMAPLFMDSPILGRVHIRDGDINYAAYDLGIGTMGHSSIQKQFPIGLCYSINILEVKNQALWVTDANLRPARLLGYEGPIPAGHVLKSSRRFNLPDGTVVIHAGCNQRYPQKRWGRWPEVCARLESLGRHVVIVGTEEDRSKDDWENLFHPQFDLSLLDLAALLDQASYFLGNDSGVGHLATAIGLPGLLLYGPSKHEIFGPNSKVMRTLVASPLQAPSVSFRSGSLSAVPPDINLLQVDRVWNEIVELLNDPSRDPPRELPMQLDRPPNVAARNRRMPAGATSDTYMTQILEYIFSVSAARLMRERERNIIIKIAKRRIGGAYILHSYQLLKRLWVSMESPTNSEFARGRYYARSGIRAGHPIKGRALLVAIWIVKRISFLRIRFGIGANWVLSVVTQRPRNTNDRQ
jgi:hypothetical protein